MNWLTKYQFGSKWYCRVYTRLCTNKAPQYRTLLPITAGINRTVQQEPCSTVKESRAALFNESRAALYNKNRAAPFNESHAALFNEIRVIRRWNE